MVSGDFLWTNQRRGVAPGTFAMLSWQKCEHERRRRHTDVQVCDWSSVGDGTQGAKRWAVRAKRGCPPPGPFARIFFGSAAVSQELKTAQDSPPALVGSWRAETRTSGRGSANDAPRCSVCPSEVGHSRRLSLV